MTCTNNTCECKPKEYHDFRTLSCLAQKTINETCYLDIMCQSGKYLECQNEQCECISSKPTWSPILDQCLGIGSYNDPCVTVNDCDGSKLLVCNSESVSCNCPLNVSENYCDCPKRSIGSEFYWDGKECIEASEFGGSCENSYMCKILTEFTVCNFENCSCLSFQYFNTENKKCEDKLNITQKCDQLDGIFIFLILNSYQIYYFKACRNDKNLICINKKCSCDETKQFWDTSEGICTDLLTYNTGDCKEDSECKSNLICRLSIANSCQCPINININKCDCKREKNDESYWSGFQCIPAKGYNRVCSNSSTSYECRTLTEGTECINGKNGFTCNCKSTQFYNFYSLKCENLINNTTTPCKQLGNNTIRNVI
jgi:hypothetical protein